MKRNKLKVLRVKHELTQQQLADKLGVSVSTYNLLEMGKRDGNKELWLDIQKLFKLEDGEVWRLINPQI